MSRWIASGAWMAETVGQVIERAAERRGATAAVIDPLGTLTYADLEARTARAAGRL